jgi:hypothetical protein
VNEEEEYAARRSGYAHFGFETAHRGKAFGKIPILSEDCKVVDGISGQGPISNYIRAQFEIRKNKIGLSDDYNRFPALPKAHPGLAARDHPREPIPKAEESLDQAMWNWLVEVDEVCRKVIVATGDDNEGSLLALRKTLISFCEQLEKRVQGYMDLEVHIKAKLREKNDAIRHMEGKTYGGEWSPINFEDKKIFAQLNLDLQILQTDQKIVLKETVLKPFPREQSTSHRPGRGQALGGAA